MQLTPAHIARLRTLPGFADLDDVELDRLAERSQVAVWRDGEPILRKGAPSETMHVLVAGAARVALPSAEDGGRSVLLNDGAVFGEIGMLSGEPRTADVLAVGDCETVVLRRADVEPLLWDHPRLARVLTNLVRKRLRRSGELVRVGKYRLLEQIGQGSSSDVYEGVHEALGRTVAIKMLSHTLAYDRPLLSRFLNEARVIASLEHPNIVRVHDTEAAFATHFIVMERLRGSDLQRVLAERRRLTASEVCALLGQAVSALCFAHGHGVVHGDVKPANCGVGLDGRLKLMDFGLATRLDGPRATDLEGLIVGTPRYMAPELATGAPADARSDLYALGVMGFEMLAGQPPFPGQAPEEILRAHVTQPTPDIAAVVRGLPTGLVQFLRAALSKDPGARPTNLQQIEAMLGTTSTEAPTLVGGGRRAVTVHLEYEAERQPELDSLLAALERGAAGLASIDVTRSAARGASTIAPQADAAHVPATVVLARRS